MPQETPPTDPSSRLELAHGTIDLSSRRFLPSDGGPEVPLTQRDLDVLTYLARNTSRRIELTELAREIWGDQPDVLPSVVEIAIRRLKTKLEPVPSAPRALLGGASEGLRLLVADTAQRAVLPKLSGPFLGRELLVRRLQEQLSEGAQLVTLVGEHGVGKARLAVEIVRQAAASGGKTLLLDVGSIHTNDTLRHLVASSLGLASADDDAILAGLAGTLLCLVRADAALDAAAMSLPKWLLSPGLRALVSCRSPLLLPSEVVVDVPALGITDGVRLFVSRIESEIGRTPPPSDEIAAVPDLIARLGGNPLAIKLAAAWYPVLDSRGVKSHLDDITRPGEEPLLTMVRAAFSLLTADEQSVLFAAVLFPSDFELSALVALSEASGRVPAAVLSLRRKGLLTEADPPGKGLSTPEIIRRFVEEERASRSRTDQTFAAAQRAVRERFARWCIGEADAVSERSQDLAAAGIERSLVSLVSAAWRIEDAALFAELVYALGPALDGSLWWSVHLSLVDRALVALQQDSTGEVPTDLDPESQAQIAALLQRRGALLLASGAFDEAAAAIERASRAAELYGDAILRAEVSLDRAALAGVRGEGDGVESGTQIAADRLRSAEEYLDPIRAARVWAGIGSNLLAASDRAGAHTAWLEVARYAREAGSHRRAATAFTRLAFLALDAGDLPEASARVGEAEAELRVLGLNAPPALVRVRSALAELRGDYSLAETDARTLAGGSARASGAHTDEPWTQHEARLALARCAFRRGDLAEAWAFAAATASVARERWVSGWVEATVLLALVYLAQKTISEAIRLREDLVAAGQADAARFIDARIHGEPLEEVLPSAPLGVRLRCALVQSLSDASEIS